MDISTAMSRALSVTVIGKHHENIQPGHKSDQTDKNRGDQLFQSQRAEKRAVVRPSMYWPKTRGPLKLQQTARHGLGAFWMLEPELENVHEVATHRIGLAPPKASENTNSRHNRRSQNRKLRVTRNRRVRGTSRNGVAVPAGSSASRSRRRRKFSSRAPIACRPRRHRCHPCPARKFQLSGHDVLQGGIVATFDLRIDAFGQHAARVAENESSDSLVHRGRHGFHPTNFCESRGDRFVVMDSAFAGPSQTKRER